MEQTRNELLIEELLLILLLYFIIFRYYSSIDGYFSIYKAFCISCCKYTAFFGILFYVTMLLARFQWASSSLDKLIISGLLLKTGQTQL